MPSIYAYHKQVYDPQRNNLFLQIDHIADSGRMVPRSDAVICHQLHKHGNG
jgi:hypothetical protein